MADVKITVLKDGPLKVQGDVTLEDHEGNPIDTRGRKAVSLCRCGGSRNQPFCDGTHTKIGFTGAEAAVAAHERQQSQDD